MVSWRLRSFWCIIKFMFSSVKPRVKETLQVKVAASFVWMINTKQRLVAMYGTEAIFCQNKWIKDLSWSCINYSFHCDVTVHAQSINLAWLAKSVCTKARRDLCVVFCKSIVLIEHNLIRFYKLDKSSDASPCLWSWNYQKSVFVVNKTRQKEEILHEKLHFLSMNTAALDIEAFWDNVWDDNKEAIYNRYQRQRSVEHWQVGLCCAGYKILCKRRIWRAYKKSCKIKIKSKKSCFFAEV